MSFELRPVPKPPARPKKARHWEDLNDLLNTLSTDCGLPRVADAIRAYVEALAAAPRADPPRETLLTFAKQVIEAGFEGDVDGGDVQAWAITGGLLIPEQRTEPCGERCACAEATDFPTECLRLCDDLRAAARAPGAE